MGSYYYYYYYYDFVDCDYSESSTRSPSTTYSFCYYYI